MSTKTELLCVKFGQKEHLEMLKNGKIFFSPIKKFREDGTDYRGDLDEGIIYIDPSKIKIFDNIGNNIFDSVPIPVSVKQSIADDDNTFMFCCAVIDNRVLCKIENNLYVITNEFKEAIKQFGDYSLIFYLDELLENISTVKDSLEIPIGYKGRKIIYKNKESDYTFMTKNFKESELFNSVYDRYFIKGMSYEKQNEYRIIIDGQRESLSENYYGGYLLETKPLKYAKIYKTKVLLDTFEYSEDNMDEKEQAQSVKLPSQE